MNKRAKAVESDTTDSQPAESGAKASKPMTPEELDKEYDRLFDGLDNVAINLIQLQGFGVMLKVLEQFKDTKNRIDFDYIETYVRQKAYKTRQTKNCIDNRLKEISALNAV